ncbi:MAG: polysaccharide biosynthesis tyrosine autokinase, partial [Bacteroidaceae bacterium]|nr:polysaccharide biosynthesis tyrosine autokinase [Bacteroidaceae bacterium]
DFLDKPENKYEMVPFTPGMEIGAASFIESYNKLVLTRLNMLASAKDGSPALSLIEKQIDASRENVITSLLTSKASNDIALKELRKQEDKITSRISTAPTQEREFISIYRQKVIKEELYIFLLQKYEENALTLAITSPKGQIVDRAFNYNKPSSLSTMMLLIIGFIIGLLIPSAYLYIKYLFRTKFSSREELEQITRVPILGEVCVNHSKERVVVKEGDTSSIAELFRLMRTNLQFLLTGKKDKVILLTSSVSGEGKSFVSVNLSISLSLLKKRTIIIGLDIRNPQLAEYMNLKAKLGMTNYLASEEISIDDIIIPSNINPQLDVIVAGPIPPNPAELLLNQRLDDLFNQLRERYDYIIIDSAPVGMVSDTFSLTRLADTTVYVCRANYTLRDHIRYCNTIVAEERLRNVSLVINATTAKQGYGYGYNQNGERVRIKNK